MILQYPATIIQYGELALIAYALYKTISWLAIDKKSPLLGYMSAYTSLIIISYTLPLPTLCAIIPIITPALLTLCVVLHQTTLQKNIIPYKKQSLVSCIPNNWIELVLRSALKHVNNAQSIVLLIENTDDLEPFIQTPFYLNTPIQETLLDILLNDKVYNGTSMMWLTKEGTIVSNRATWLTQKQNTKQKTSTSDVLYELDYLYTTKTDALICRINQQNRTCTLLFNEQVLHTVTTYNAQKIIYQYLQKKSLDKKTYKKEVYDTASIYTHKQHTS